LAVSGVSGTTPAGYTDTPHSSPQNAQCTDKFSRDTGVTVASPFSHFGQLTSIASPRAAHGPRHKQTASYSRLDPPQNPFARILTGQRHFRLVQIVLEQALVLFPLEGIALVLDNSYYVVNVHVPLPPRGL